MSTLYNKNTGPFQEDPKLKRKIDRRYRRAERKIGRAERSGSKRRIDRANKLYGYDYDAAKAIGATPDETGHWQSRDPESGRIFKGRRHPTIFLTRKAEREAGYKMYRKKGLLYSKKIN